MRFRRSVLVLHVLLLFGCVDRELTTGPAVGDPSMDITTQSVVYLVDNLLDDGSPGSLRYAIFHAGSGHNITFDPALAGATIELNGDVLIDKSLTILGPPGGITISGGGNNRVFRIQGAYHVVLDNLTIRDGRPTSGSGGAIQNVGGNLTIRNSTVADSWAPVAGGGIFVINSGSLIIENSTIVNNGLHPDMVQRTEIGGGISGAQSAVSIINSTVSGNSAASGGGITNREGTLTIVHGTVADNGASFGGGILNQGRSGFPATTTLVNTIVAANFSSTLAAGPDFLNVSTFSADPEQFVQLGASHSIVGTTSGHALSGALIGVDAGFELDVFGKALLADNGGPTWTHALLDGSPAIGAADGDVCVAAPVNGRDQRGTARPQGAGCDIGAVEMVGSVVAPPLAVASLILTESGTVDKKTGVAYATGTMSCPTPGIVELEVQLAQEQNQKRLKVTVAGSTTISVPCDGETGWAAAVTAGNGNFVNGDASVSAATTNVAPAAQAAGSTRLFWSR